MQYSLTLARRYLGYLWPHRWQMLAVFVLSGAAALLGAVNPYVSRFVVDRGLLGRDPQLFLLLMGAVGAIFLLTSGVMHGQEYLRQTVDLHVGRDLQRDALRQLLGADLAALRRQASGDRLYRVNYDVSRISELVTTVPPQSVALICQALLALALIWHLHWLLAIGAIAVVPMLYIPRRAVARRLRDLYGAWVRQAQHAHRWWVEVLSRIHVIKACGTEQTEVRRQEQRLDAALDVKLHTARVEAGSRWLLEAIQRGAAGLLACYGGYLVIRGALTLGELTAVMLYVRQLVAVQGELGRLAQTIAVGLVSCDRVEEILSTSPAIREAVPAVHRVFHGGAVHMRDVSFAYLPGQPVLERCSLEIPAAAHVALVGPSGCGKTTLVHLLLRLYEPDHGVVLIDGHDVRDLSWRSLREQIGVAYQKPWLWNETIEYNLRYGRPEATSEDVQEVAELCGVAPFVERLPEGYAMVVGEDACRLSEGQQQRIAIARALLKQPRLLVLDEAMASLDAESEERIITRIRETHPATTLIVVSHRWATVARAEMVYYLQRPDAVAVGTAAALAERDVAFRALFQADAPTTGNIA